MGCLNLTYRENPTPLKVVYNAVKTSKKGCAGFYRYGFQGWERDNEISGVGNSYTTFFRQHDPRLGRTWSPDPKRQYPSPYVMLGNNPINGLDPDGAWFWEKSNVRQARAFAKETGGEFNKWKGQDGKRYASVTINSTEAGTGSSNADGTEVTLDQQNVTAYMFRPGQDRSDLLMQSGVGFYESARAAATGWGRITWALKSGDAWAHGWGEYNRGGQAPGVIKAIAGINPLVSVPNAGKILIENTGNALGLTDKTPTDIYGVESSSAVDVGVAAFGIIAPLNPGKAILGPTTAGKVIDAVNTTVQFSNDAGWLDPIKTQKSDSIKKD